jgi:outer membrane protein assembly factor BamA
MTVIFSVRDLPNLVKQVVYHGSHHLGKADQISKDITHIFEGEPLDPLKNKMACQAIVNKLNEDGRPFGACELLKGDQPGDTDVVFNISEGPQAKITGIGFEGNTFVRPTWPSWRTITSRSATWT